MAQLQKIFIQQPGGIL